MDGDKSSLEDRVVIEKFHTWTVSWKLDEFTIRTPEGRSAGSFKYRCIILPVDILNDGAARAALSLDPNWRAEVLRGVPMAELNRFKRKVSGHVLAAVRSSPFGCSDCAHEARMTVFGWDGNPCPGCRLPYCRNPKCFHRLIPGKSACGRCGTENSHSKNTEHPYVNLI